MSTTKRKALADAAATPEPVVVRLPELDVLRVSIAREVLMAGIQANINRKEFVGMNLGAAADFAVEAADKLIAALMLKKA